MPSVHIYLQIESPFTLLISVAAFTFLHPKRSIISVIWCWVARAPELGCLHFLLLLNSFQVYWEIHSESDISGDFLRTEGSVVIADQQSAAEIIIYLLPDDVPELDENYVVQLISVEGGADLDPEKSISKINVFANDDPYGVFALYSELQSVLVEKNLDRFVQVNVTRHAGAFGEVIVEYHITSHLEELLIEPGNEVGYLTVEDGASFGVKQVPISNQVCVILSLPMIFIGFVCVHKDIRY